MPQTIGYIRGPGRRTRVPNGQYVECRTGLLGLSKCQGCRRCGGDGYRKVGVRKKGRPAGGKRRGPKGALRRGAWRVSWGGAFVALGHSRFGTIGAVVVAVLVVVWLGVALFAAATRALAS